MPVISVFYGMIIKIYHNDHNPPHFHVEYGSKEAWVEIHTGQTIGDKFSPRLSKDIEKWRKLYKPKLLKAWNDAQNHKIPKRIKPLE